ncbi:MAG TPA: CAP domain-containing protein [Thermoleophilia bacterium]|nr:CAP domain-containing protein [Thermoleophilia bacterium]
MRKALAIICLALLASLSAFALPALLRPATARAATPTTAEKRLIAAVNRVRVNHDLAKVRCRSFLLVAARFHADELADRELLTHKSECGWTLAQRVRHLGYTADGYTYWTIGEDLAHVTAGTSAARARAVVRRWMRSSAHRAVLLAPKIRDIGVGTAVGADGMKYVTVDLGRRIM